MPCLQRMSCVVWWFHPHCPLHDVFLSSCSAELGRKHSQSCGCAKSSGSSSAERGLKKPHFANKDLLHVCEGSLGREKIITWQQLLGMTRFPGNLAALQAGIWIEVELLEALIPLRHEPALPPPAPAGAVSVEVEVSCSRAGCGGLVLAAEAGKTLLRSVVCLESRLPAVPNGRSGCGQAAFLSSAGLAPRHDLRSYTLRAEAAVIIS